MADDPALHDHLPGIDSSQLGPSRRQVLFAGAGAVAAVVLAACGGGDSDSSTGAAPDTTIGSPGTSGATPTTTATPLAPTPACDDGDDPTPAQTEGPYFTANSPEQTDLRSGAGGGTALNLSGTVVTTGCQPVGQAKMELWQAAPTASTTTPAIASAAISSPTPRAATQSRPSCPASTPAAPATST